jgi:hypothetical protein
MCQDGKSVYSVRYSMTSTDPLLNSTLQHLRDLRQTLLRLHKALLDSERVEYEQFHGRIKSTSFFN